MKFTSHSIAGPEPALKTVSLGKVDIPAKFSGIPELVVNLIPDHPYQYPLHEHLGSALTAAAITALKQTLGIENISFLIGKDQRKSYDPIIRKIPCTARYLDPEYPFKRKKAGIKTEASMIGWYEFLVLSAAMRGETYEQIPVTITVFDSEGSNETKVIACTIPVSIVAITEALGINSQDFTISDHPFIGEILSSDKLIDTLGPKEILLFPKTDVRKESPFGTFKSKFMPRHERFRKSFNVSALYRNHPCQKCLECVRICPEGLNPFLLSAVAAKGNLKDAVELDIGDCSKCGLCSCICPSGIPLMKSILGLKKEL